MFGERTTLAAIVAMTTMLSATAQAATPEQKAAAQALFDDAKRLASAGKYPDACPKFEASQKLDPSVSTRFKLGDCYEHLGKTATAWALYLDVLAASRGNRQKERYAQQRVDAIVPKLTRLTITVQAPAPGIEVKRDGTTIDSAAWRTALPVDPGPHAFNATAPGKIPWSSTIEVNGEGKTVDVTIPALSNEAPIARTSAPPPVLVPVVAPAPQPVLVREDHGMSGQRAAGVVLSGVGVVGLAVGAIFGGVAIAKNDQALQPENCRTSTLCTQHGLDLTSSAHTAATVSTVGFVAGGLALASGIILIATGGERSSAHLEVRASSNGLSTSGSF